MWFTMLVPIIFQKFMNIRREIVSLMEVIGILICPLKYHRKKRVSRFTPRLLNGR